MRARQIQNDVVVLIYQEGNTTYNPETMPTNVAHVFAVVRPFNDPVTGEQKYRYVAALLSLRTDDSRLARSLAGSAWCPRRT